MTPRFADSSYFYALMMPQAEYHEAAVQFAREPSPSVVTTDYVLIEVANSLRLPRTRALFGLLIRGLSTTPEVEIVACSHELTLRGVQFYLDRSDKEWSLTDCVPFLIMQERGITEALTSDHHFEQAGFVALLRS